MSAAVISSRVLHPPAFVHEATGNEYQDPTNRVYSEVFGGGGSEVFSWLGAEKKGDLLEGVLGAAFLLLDDRVPTGRAGESFLRAARDSIEGRVSRVIEQSWLGMP